MAKDKKSVVLYCDIIHTVEKLDDKTAGELFKHYLRYINDLNPKTENPIVDIVFEPIKQNLKRDLKKYLARCGKNKENAEKRWDANACERIQADAKHADNENDNENVNGKDKEKRVVIDYTSILTSFNSICTKLPKIKEMTSARKKLVRARNGSLSGRWEELFRAVDKSPFLCGDNDRGWKASFDWLITNDKNWAKVLEGNYSSEPKGKEQIKKCSCGEPYKLLPSGAWTPTCECKYKLPSLED